MTLTTASLEALAAQVEAELAEGHEVEYRPRWNIAPTQPHWIVTAPEGRRRLEPAFWGVRHEKNPGINARVESIKGAPQWRDAFKARRCLVPADGFFEWTGEKRARRPIWFHPPRGGVLLFAGVFEPAPAGLLFAVLTTKANALVGEIHDRMPVILGRERATAWLAEASTAGLGPAPESALVAVPVSTRVSSVANDDPACIAPAVPWNEQLGLF